MEGETILILAGAASHRGYLALLMVISVGSVASFLGDQLYFYVGRRYGTALLRRFPPLQPRAIRANALLERHHVPLILAIRFLYSLRIAGPIVMGMSALPWFRFLVLNFIGAVVWATIFAGAGYGFGQGMSYLLPGFDQDEAWWLASILIAVLLWWLLIHRKQRSPRNLTRH